MREGLDVVVVNYRTPGDLGGFLDSFTRHSGHVATSLTIANVAPLPGDEKLAHFFAERHDADIVTFTENVGYARACNHAATLGDRKVLAFFNADVRLTAGALDECYGALMARPDWGVLGPRQIDDHGRYTHAGIFGTQAQPSMRGWHKRVSGAYEDIRDDAVSVSGAAYFVPRKVWADLTGCEVYREIAPDAEGAFLPTPHYYEETWCSYHAQAHGLKCVYFGTVTIVHRWHQASPVGGRAERLMPQSRAMFRAACDRHGIPHD
jgi:GT2 family glycosyltransferase